MVLFSKRNGEATPIIKLSSKEETSVRAEVLLSLLSLHDGSARRPKKARNAA